MSKYKVGQRVRVEYANGTVLEGVLAPGRSGGRFSISVGWTNPVPVPIASEASAITILAEPRPEEPKGLGAVVEAGINHNYGPTDPYREIWVRTKYDWVQCNGTLRANWVDLADPIVKHEGWSE